MFSIACWKSLIDDCLPYENEKVRNAAATALSALIERHYVVNGKPDEEICGPVILKCKSEVMSASSESIRIGYAIALGKHDLKFFTFLLHPWYGEM